MRRIPAAIIGASAVAGIAVGSTLIIATWPGLVRTSASAQSPPSPAECPPTDAGRPGNPTQRFDVTQLHGTTTITICQYGWSPERGHSPGLQSQHVITDTAARALADQLSAAPYAAPDACNTHEAWGGVGFASWYVLHIDDAAGTHIVPLHGGIYQHHGDCHKIDAIDDPHGFRRLAPAARTYIFQLPIRPPGLLL